MPETVSSVEFFKAGPEMEILAGLSGLAGIGLYLKKFNLKGVKRNE